MLLPTHTACHTVTSINGQVKEIHTMLVSKVDNINMVVDEWGTKRLVSYCLRAYRTGVLNFRD